MSLASSSPLSLGAGRRAKTRRLRTTQRALDLAKCSVVVLEGKEEGGGVLVKKRGGEEGREEEEGECDGYILEKREMRRKGGTQKWGCFVA